MSNQSKHQWIVRLEPVFLSNVLLFFTNVNDVKAFVLVSKPALTATRILKTTPFLVSEKPLTITTLLTLFPNINTLSVHSFEHLRAIETLPDQVSAIIVDHWNADIGPATLPSFADRIVEVKHFSSIDEWDATLSGCHGLQKLAIDQCYGFIDLPSHKLKRIRITAPQFLDPIEPIIESDSCETLQFINLRGYCSEEFQSFVQSFPHIDYFYNDLNYDLTPSYFWAPTSPSTVVELWNKRLSAHVHSLNARVLLPFRDVQICSVFEAHPDLSLFSFITSLSTPVFADLMTIPTTIVKLELKAKKR